MQFKVKGSRLKHKIWNWIFNVSQKRVKSNEDKIINVISLSFPSAFCLLIRYEILNDSLKYEIVLQGDYQDSYRQWKENEESNNIPENINIELIIKNNHKHAKQITLKK